MMVRIR